MHIRMRLLFDSLISSRVEEGHSIVPIDDHLGSSTAIFQACRARTLENLVLWAKVKSHLRAPTPAKYPYRSNTEYQ